MTKNKNSDTNSEKTFSEANLNLNISASEEMSNDYLFSWNEFGKKPNKISIPGKFDAEQIWTYIEKTFSYDEENFVVEKDIVVEGNVMVTYKKISIKLNDDNTIITFRQMDELDKETNDMVIDIYGICIFYKNLNDFLISTEADLVNMCIGENDENYYEFEESKNKILKFDNESGKFALELLEQDMSVDFDNIELYYNDETFKQVKKWMKKLKHSKKGLSLVLADRGYGKTSLASYMMKKMNNKFIYIPSYTIEHVLHNPEFMEFMKFNKETIYVVDDCENYFNKTYQKTSIVVNNLLQMVDGLKSDSYSSNFILLMNCGESSIDENLFECNNLVETIEINKLSIEECDELSEHLKLNVKHKISRKLNDVIKGVQTSTKAFGYIN